MGEWHSVSGGIAAKIGKLLEDVPDLDNVDYPDIDDVLNLRSDGTFTLSADDDGSMEAISPSGGIFSAEINISLEKQGTWSINGNRLIQCYMPNRVIEIDETVTDPYGLSQNITASKYLGPIASYTEKRRFTY